ncbi:MAG: DNA alkylation repair protein [Flavobacteriales bacterium]|jgi:3-methyladenine DNA glycosylase AlkC|nr:DNA alkylation repair protein [Flavobacteriales bacterium]
MATALKDLYTQDFIENLASPIQRVQPDFDFQSFSESVFDKNWKSFELKDRMSWISVCLHKGLPKHWDFSKHLNFLVEFTHEIAKTAPSGLNFLYMFLPVYIEKNGTKNLKESLLAIEKITQFTSCEFTVRPLLIAHPNLVLESMKNWSQHPHPMVRRLASEGCRLYLPWGKKVPILFEETDSILLILNQLINDSHESIRKSVSNSLNDLSKFNKNKAILFTKTWINKNETINKTLKHGCRTLLKLGDSQIMPLFGYASAEQTKMENFVLKEGSIKIGEKLSFSFTLKNISEEKILTRIEYCIYFLRKNGTYHKKVFKISEKITLPLQQVFVKKNHDFKIISTRKYYGGVHSIGIIINGSEQLKESFILSKQ